MIRRPVAVEPVKLTDVDLRVGDEQLADRAADGLGQDVDHAGGDVGVSAMSRPRAAVIHGVCGGPFTTTVHPAASAGASFASVIWIG